MAARWRRGDLDKIDEWGLGGRRFGTVVTWFLLGGDVYTAYTFIAVPALVFAVGAQGFFALPYTIIVYPLVFMLMPRLWAVAHATRLRDAGRLREGALRQPDAWRWSTRSPACWRRCPTSRSSWSAWRWCSQAMGIEGDCR